MPVIRNLERVKMIDVLFIAPKSLPAEISMPATSRTIKELINGPIKTIYLTTGTRDKVAILCSANKDRSLASANRYLAPYGIIYGSFIILRETSNGDYKSLTKEQINNYQELFNEDSINKVDARIKNLVALRRKIRSM